MKTLHHENRQQTVEDSENRQGQKVGIFRNLKFVSVHLIINVIFLLEQKVSQENV